MNERKDYRERARTLLFELVYYDPERDNREFHSPDVWKIAAAFAEIRREAEAENKRLRANLERTREALSATAEMLETLAMGLPSTNMLRARQAERAALIARRALAEGGPR